MSKPVKTPVLIVCLNGRTREVSRPVYVEAKTRQLQEFGYPFLTTGEVDRQIDALLAKKAFGEGLTVIGMLMEDEVVGLARS